MCCLLPPPNSGMLLAIMSLKPVPIGSYRDQTSLLFYSLYCVDPGKILFVNLSSSTFSCTVFLYNVFAPKVLSVCTSNVQLVLAAVESQVSASLLKQSSSGRKNIKFKITSHHSRTSMVGRKGGLKGNWIEYTKCLYKQTAKHICFRGGEERFCD